MNAHARRAIEVETEFLAGAEANFEQAKGRQLRGTSFRTVRQDETERLRQLALGHGIHDSELLRRLPHNGRIIIHGHDRRWWLGKRRACVAVASVMAPLEAYLPGEGGQVIEPTPVGLPELAEHARRLMVDEDVPHLIGVCSPSGFTEQAKACRLDLPNVTLVLVEQRDEGDWVVQVPGGTADENIVQLFDPKAVSQKLRRVREQIDQRSADLLTGGLSARAIGTRLALPVRVVEDAFAQAATADPELHVARRGGEVFLFRGAPVAEETSTMSVVDRIRQLFSREGDEAKKINLLSERRVSLSSRRDRIYEDLAKLEEREAYLLDQGRQAKSDVVKRRLAAQLKQVRHDIARQNASANMLNDQINVVSTHIHNLTLIQQGQIAQVPPTEQITLDAVRAEEMLEQIRADSDLASSLEVGADESLTSAEEREILKEFEQPSERVPEAKETPQVESLPPQREQRPEEPEAT